MISNLFSVTKAFLWSGVEMSISVQNLNGWMFAVQRRKEVWGLETSKSGIRLQCLDVYG